MTRKIDLTLGMAVADDWKGVWATIQGLRLMHPEVMDRCEILVVDNKPDSPEGKKTHGLMGWVKQPGELGRYIAMPEPQGTAAPRQRVFDEARGELVVCMDPHIFIVPGALAKLLAWHEAHRELPVLLQGPLQSDNLEVMATHFDDVWRGEMWGIWCKAWVDAHGLTFSAREMPGRRLGCFTLKGKTPLKTCSPRKRNLEPIGDIGWDGHEATLREHGCRELGASTDEPFPIPAMGLGLFACQKRFWPGFNPAFRGFGGEEFYVHQKIETLCLPFFQWVHRFGYVGNQPPYSLTVDAKLRNYLIGCRETGVDPSRALAEFAKRLTPPQIGAIVKEVYQ